MAIERMLTFELTDDEAVLLRETLAEYLADLSREVAAIESADFRSELRHRQETLRRLLDRLGRVA